MTDQELAEHILRRRQQVWVHSILYYRMNYNIISDAQWSEWAEELEQLQKDYPEISSKVRFYDIFKDFDHSTGSDLPLDDPRMTNVALHLMMRDEKKKGRI